MDGITLEFNDIIDAKKFVKRIKKTAKVFKFLTINDMYLYYRLETGKIIRTSPDDHEYGWTYALLSGVKIVGTDVIMPTFIKLRRKK